MKRILTMRGWMAACAVLIILAFVGTGVGRAVTTQPKAPPPKVGLAISPPTFELSANPGDTLKNSLRVDNISGMALDVSVDKRNFTALGEEGGVDLSDREGKYSLANWITVTPDKIVIQPGESKTFNYIVAVPTFAEPGGRFGSIVFKTTAQPVSGQSGVAIAQEVGALVFLKVAGHIDERASIVDFKTRNKLHELGPVNFDLRVKNEGNVQFKPTGTITISNFFGKKIATIPVDGQNVLPDATRKMAAKWSTRWLLGKYTATLSVTHGNGEQILTASTAFWGFPYRLIVAALVMIVVAVVLIYPRRQRLARAFKVLFGKE